MNLVNVCPDIPDSWRGGRKETAAILGISERTLDRYAAMGRHGGIEWKPNMMGRGKTFTGKDIKRFWMRYR